MEWMENYLDGTKAEQTALGMIQIDIAEHGFENWLRLPAIPIVKVSKTSLESQASDNPTSSKSPKALSLSRMELWTSSTPCSST